jgi:hypothetical protein
MNYRTDQWPSIFSLLTDGNYDRYAGQTFATRSREGWTQQIARIARDTYRDRKIGAPHKVQMDVYAPFGG